VSGKLIRCIDSGRLLRGCCGILPDPVYTYGVNCCAFLHSSPAAWDDETVYNTGDFVTHEGVAYYSTIDNNTGEPFTPHLPGAAWTSYTPCSNSTWYHFAPRYGGVNKTPKYYSVYIVIEARHIVKGYDTTGGVCTPIADARDFYYYLSVHLQLQNDGTCLWDNLWNYSTSFLSNYARYDLKSNNPIYGSWQCTGETDDVEGEVSLQLSPGASGGLRSVLDIPIMYNSTPSGSGCDESSTIISALNPSFFNCTLPGGYVMDCSPSFDLLSTAFGIDPIAPNTYGERTLNQSCSKYMDSPGDPCDGALAQTFSRNIVVSWEPI
jgi:hypothetical protein